MRVDAFLADTVDKVNGKLYVLGAGWNVIVASRVPMRHPRIGIGLLIRVPYTETDTHHDLSVRLEDADGAILAVADHPTDPAKKLHSLDHRFQIGRPAQLPPGAEQVVPMALNISGLGFADYGNYRFVVTIDSQESALLPIAVISPPDSGA